MKKILIVAALAVSTLALADKDIGKLLSSTAKAVEVCFIPADDGGVHANVAGKATNADGGFTYTSTVEFRDLTGAPRTTGLDALTKGTAAWQVKEVP